MDWKSAHQKEGHHSINWNLQASLKFAFAHMHDPNVFWRNVLWSDETKIELFVHNDKRHVWRRKCEAFKPNRTVPGVKRGGGGGSIMLCAIYQYHSSETTQIGWKKKEVEFLPNSSTSPQINIWVIKTWTHTSKLVLEWLHWLILSFWNGLPSPSLSPIVDYTWSMHRKPTILNELYQFSQGVVEYPPWVMLVDG